LLFQFGNPHFEFRNARGLLSDESMRLLELLYQFVVGHHVFTIHGLRSNFNPTFLRLTPGHFLRQMR